MQQMMIYWQAVIPQHVSGVFMPIIRTADCVPLPMVAWLQPGSILCTVHTSHHPTLRNHNNHSQDRKPQAVARSLLSWWWA